MSPESYLYNKSEFSPNNNKYLSKIQEDIDSSEEIQVQVEVSRHLKS